MFILPFARFWRVKVLLQNGVEPLYPQLAFAHWGEDLDLVGRRAHVRGQLVPDQCDQDADNGCGVVALHTEKVRSFVVQVNGNACIDLMGIGDNGAFHGLPDTRSRVDHTEAMGINNVFQHISRPYRGKLVHIPHKDQPGSRHDSLEKGVHQIYVNHGHFINNDHIRL